MTSRYLNLAWFLPAILLASCSGPAVPLFVDVTELSGLNFKHQTPDANLELPSILGSGVALFDMDNDGDLDVFLVQGAGSSSAPHELWRNDSDDSALRFNRVQSGLALEALTPGVGVAIEDVDLDGRLDVFVSSLGVDRLLLNRENGFEVSSAFALENGWSSSVAFTDINVDGLPDVLITRVGVFDSTKVCRSLTRQIDYCGADAFEPLTDQLWLNRGKVESGDVSFDDVSDEYGLGGLAIPSLSARVADFNADGWPDIYVAAYQTGNALWINQRGRRLSERALSLGGTSSFVPEFRSSVGVDAADIDADGDLDLVVTHHRGEPHQLYRNDGNGGFLAGTLGASIMTEADSGMGVALFDANADSQLDVYVANGALRRRQSQIDASDELPLRQSNTLILQHVAPPVSPDLEPSAIDRGLDTATALVSEEMTHALNSTPAAFVRWIDEEERLTPRTRVSRGVAVGDLDNDGDLDLVVTNNGTTAEVLQNTTDPERWIGIVPVSAVTGLPLNGTRVTLKRPQTDGPVDESPPNESGSSELAVKVSRESSVGDGVREVRRSHGYLSSSDPRLIYYGPFDQVVEIVVVWPGGDAETFSIAPESRYFTLIQGQGES